MKANTLTQEFLTDALFVFFVVSPAFYVLGARGAPLLAGHTLSTLAVVMNFGENVPTEAVAVANTLITTFVFLSDVFVTSVVACSYGDGCCDDGRTDASFSLRFEPCKSSNTINAFSLVILSSLCGLCILGDLFRLWKSVPAEKSTNFTSAIVFVAKMFQIVWYASAPGSFQDAYRVVLLTQACVGGVLFFLDFVLGAPSVALKTAVAYEKTYEWVSKFLNWYAQTYWNVLVFAYSCEYGVTLFVVSATRAFDVEFLERDSISKPLAYALCGLVVSCAYARMIAAVYDAFSFSENRNVTLLGSAVAQPEVYVFVQVLGYVVATVVPILAATFVVLERDIISPLEILVVAGTLFFILTRLLVVNISKDFAVIATLYATAVVSELGLVAVLVAEIISVGSTGVLSNSKPISKAFLMAGSFIALSHSMSVAALFFHHRRVESGLKKNQIESNAFRSTNEKHFKL